MAKIGVIILGASGFGAGELLRLSVGHPDVEVVQLVSSSQAGQPVGAIHPHLDGFVGLELSAGANLDLLDGFERKFVVSALPHSTSAQAISQLVSLAKPDLQFLDLSGDFRLLDHQVHQQFYPDSALLPDLRRAFVYGLPELNGDRVKSARFISNPGCLATATILALAPLTAAGLIKRASVTASTGSSGAGRGLKESVHHALRHSNLFAYKALSHQHQPEIVQALAGKLSSLAFVAQSAPFSRGISVVASAQLVNSASAKQIEEQFSSFYAKAPFVRLRSSSPEVQNVVGSNFCDIAVQARGDEVVVLAVLDNLVKGMAGQALQNINLAAGLAETTALWTPSLRPI